MTGLRKAALAAITLLVAAATSASFAESYRAPGPPEQRATTCRADHRSHRYRDT